MAIAVRETICVFRKDPLCLQLAVAGPNLTGATMALAARDYPDAPGAARLLLATVAEKGATGIRLVSATRDADGVWWNLIEFFVPKATIAALPAAAQPGGDLLLSYDFQWTEADDASGFTAAEQTIWFGDFIVKGSCND